MARRMWIFLSDGRSSTLTVRSESLAKVKGQFLLLCKENIILFELKQNLAQETPETTRDKR